MSGSGGDAHPETFQPETFQQAEANTMAANGIPEVIRVEHLSKRFGPVHALRDVNLHVRKGEVLGLIGDNGAGKSTLIKILTGYHRPDGGRILFNGDEVHFRSVVHARSLGIETVYQDLALINDLPVYLNLHLNKEAIVSRGWPFLRRREMKRQAREALDAIGINIPNISAQVGALSGGQRQAIAVARSVHSDAKLLLLDEPLAAMGAKEGGLILRLIDELKRRGDLAILLIAHNYNQVVDVCDRVNLLQHGEITFDKAAKETSVPELLELVHAEYRVAANDQTEENQVDDVSDP